MSRSCCAAQVEGRFENSHRGNLTLSCLILSTSQPARGWGWTRRKVRTGVGKPRVRGREEGKKKSKQTHATESVVLHAACEWRGKGIEEVEEEDVLMACEVVVRGDDGGGREGM